MKKNKYQSDFKVYNNRENYNKKTKEKELRRKTIREENKKEFKRINERDIYKKYTTYIYDVIAYHCGFTNKFKYRTTYLEKKYNIERIIENPKYNKVDILWCSIKDYYLKSLENLNIPKYIVNPEYLKIINNYLLLRKLRIKLPIKNKIVIKKI